MESMFEVPGSSISSVLINQQVVEGTTPPIYQHSKVEADPLVKRRQRGGV